MAMNRRRARPMSLAFLGLVAAVSFGPIAQAQAADEACKGGKVKYYRNPMGAPDISPVPKKDSMGMDYIPVCEDEAPQAPDKPKAPDKPEGPKAPRKSEAPGTVRISLDKVQRLGVRSAAVEERALSRTVRAFATLQFDERQQYVVAPKFGGWIEKLLVNATGDPVHRGQTLFEVYSPELNVLQQEYLVARGVQGRQEVADNRLRNLDYPPAAFDRLRRGEAPRVIGFPSPANGTVVEKRAIEGARFQPGDVLFRIVDTSTMWVMAEVYEQDLAFVKPGDRAKITINAWPDRPIIGKVAYIYPSVGAKSRTARLRIEVANPDGLLRADMAATVEIASPLGKAVAVPESAVIDSGLRQVVLVERGQGLYEPRRVELGAHAGGYVQVRAGLEAGERVVTSATFLIDAESNLRAALAAFTAGEGQ